METLNEVAKSQNATETVLLFIVIGVVLVLFGIPIYRLVSKTAKEKREYWGKREKVLMDVVKENTVSNTELVSVLRNMTQNCDDCRREQNEKLVTINNGITRLQTTVDERLNRRKNDEKINNTN